MSNDSEHDTTANDNAHSEQHPHYTAHGAVEALFAHFRDRSDIAATSRAFKALCELRDHYLPRTPHGMLTARSDGDSAPRSASDSSDDDVQPLAPGEAHPVQCETKWERWRMVEGIVYFESMATGGGLWIRQETPHVETVERAAAYLRQQRREARAKGGA